MRTGEVAPDTFLITFVELGRFRKKIQYEKTMINEMDYRAAMKYREEKGRKEGKLEIAQKMLAKGMDMENITELTGLTPQEIEELVG